MVVIIILLTSLLPSFLTANLYQCFLLSFACFFVFCVSKLRLLSYFKPLICVLTTMFCVYKLLNLSNMRLLCASEDFLLTYLLTYLLALYQSSLMSQASFVYLSTYVLIFMVFSVIISLRYISAIYFILSG